MSEPETFVARWSRLKRQSERGVDEHAEAARQPRAGTAPTEPPAAGEGAAAGAAAPAPRPAPAFDPASLPSIESIAADTDVRAFLRSGVPGELTRAALRRAWSADPAIRDFIGLAENQWDFTDPTAIAGFGPLDAADDVRKLVAQAMGKAGETAGQPEDAIGIDERTAASDVHRNAAPDTHAPSPPDGQGLGMPHEIPDRPITAEERADQQDRVDVAVQDDRQPAKALAAASRRGHGSALPQ